MNIGVWRGSQYLLFFKCYVEKQNIQTFTNTLIQELKREFGEDYLIVKSRQNAYLYGKQKNRGISRGFFFRRR